MLWNGGTPPTPSRAPSRCPATPLTASASLNGICNRPQPLRQPPPTAHLPPTTARYRPMPHGHKGHDATPSGNSNRYTGSPAAASLCGGTWALEFRNPFPAAGSALDPVQGAGSAVPGAAHARRPGAARAMPPSPSAALCCGRSAASSSPAPS